MADEQESSSWHDDLEGIAAAAAGFATEIVTPYVADAGAVAGVRFPLNGVVRYLAEGAPQPAQNAATLLSVLDCLPKAIGADDSNAAAYLAFQAGLLASAVWKDSKGRSLSDLLERIESLDRGRSLALTDTEIGRAKVLFGNLKHNNATNNDAVEQVLDSINSVRDEKVSKSTIERAVGVRQK